MMADDSYDRRVREAAEFASGLVNGDALGQTLARETVAKWMIANRFATGHGDTLEDLLAELKWQVEERYTKSDFNEVRRADMILVGTMSKHITMMVEVLTGILDWYGGDLDEADDWSDCMVAAAAALAMVRGAK